MSGLYKNTKAFVDEPMVRANDLFDEGLEFTKTKEYEKALSIFAQYKNYHPEDPAVYCEIAICHYSMQEYDQALKILDQVFKLNKNYNLALKMKGLVLLEKNDLQQAVALLEYSNVLLPGDEDILFGLLTIYGAMCLYEAGLSCLKQLLVIEPNNINYRFYEIKFKAALFQYDEAITLMDKLLIENPNDEHVLELSIEIEELKSRIIGCRYVGMNN